MGKSFWSVFKYEILRTVKKKAFLFSMFGLPVLGFLLIFVLRLGTGNQDPTQQLMNLALDTGGIRLSGYVDYSGMFPTVGEFASSAITRYEDEASARAALDAGEIQAYYIIPEDYIETGDIQSVIPDFSLNSISEAPIRMLFLSQIGEKVNQQQLTLLGVPPTFQVNKLEKEATDRVVDENANSGAVGLFAFLFILALFGTNGYLMQTVIEEKETRLIEILLSSVTPMSLLTGKILALGVLGLAQLAIYIVAVLIGVIFFGGDLSFVTALNLSPQTIIILVIYFLLGYLFFAAAFGAIGALSTSITEGPALATVFILPAMLPLMLSFIFSEDPNSSAAVFLSIFPLTSPMGMVMRTSIIDVPIGELLLSIGILTISVIGMLWFAARLFREHTLLAGAGFKLRDIPRLVFGR
ncbi:MAG: ABC transporter permease [Anaerolineae bacterium]|jgi:ABC-2 type transport system permease protein|nr:ABC transporter permease [Anaerolineae bacterium]